MFIVTEYAALMQLTSKVKTPIYFLFVNKNIKYRYSFSYRRMAENGWEFCRHILSCRELKAESFKRCLHSVLRGVSLKEPVTYVT